MENVISRRAIFHMQIKEGQQKQDQVQECDKVYFCIENYEHF